MGEPLAGPFGSLRCMNFMVNHMGESVGVWSYILVNDFYLHMLLEVL